MSWVFRVFFSDHCNGVASFNCDDKKTSVLGLTCWCHMSNIMPDFFFHERIWQRLTCFIFFMYFVFANVVALSLWIDTSVFIDEVWWSDGTSFITITSVGMKQFCLRLVQMRFMNIQWDLKFEWCQVISG